MMIFKHFEIEDRLYDLVSEYYALMGEPLGKPLYDCTKSEMDDLIDQTFEWYKTGFKCYETIRAKIRNKLTPIKNAQALIEHSIKTKLPFSKNEMKFISESIQLTLDGMLKI